MAPIQRRTTVVSGPPSPSSNGGGGHGLSSDDIIGIVFGVITFLGILLTAYPAYFRFKKREFPFTWWPADARPLPADAAAQQDRRRRRRRRDQSSSGTSSRTSRTSGTSGTSRSGGRGGGQPMSHAPPLVGQGALPALAFHQPAELEARIARG